MARKPREPRKSKAELLWAPSATTGTCPLCGRELRILTKHEVEGFGKLWSCADVEGCSEAAVAEASRLAFMTEAG